MCSATRQRVLKRRECYPTHQRSNNHSQKQCDNICPGRKGYVGLDDNDEAKDEAEYEQNHEPPPRCLLVVLCHVGVVTVVKFPLPSTLVRAYNISSPEQEAVSNKGADLGQSQSA